MCYTCLASPVYSSIIFHIVMLHVHHRRESRESIKSDFWRVQMVIGKTLKISLSQDQNVNFPCESWKMNAGLLQHCLVPLSCIALSVSKEKCIINVVVCAAAFCSEMNQIDFPLIISVSVRVRYLSVIAKVIYCNKFYIPFLIPFFSISPESFISSLFLFHSHRSQVRM